MPENSFDIVSKIDLQEVSNAIQHALKEVHTRFDLKDSKSNIELEGKEAIVLHSIDEFKLKAVSDIVPMGSYAIQFLWASGHIYGIYTWDYLLEICPCEEHAGKNSPNVPN